AGAKQKELTLDQHQIRFSFLKLKKSLIMFVCRVGNFQSATNCPDGNQRLFGVNGQDSGIISNSSGWFERSLNLLVQLVGVGNFGQTPDNQLGGKVELLLNRVVL